MSGQNYFAQQTTLTVEDAKWLFIPNQHNRLVDFLNTLTDGEDFVECWSIGLPNSRVATYDQLWLIDMGTAKHNEIGVALIQNINTSSPIAMWSCGFDGDEEEPEEDDYDAEEWKIIKEGRTLDQLIDMVGDGWKEGLRKVMEKEY